MYALVVVHFQVPPKLHTGQIVIVQRGSNKLCAAAIDSHAYLMILRTRLSGPLDRVFGSAKKIDLLATSGKHVMDSTASTSAINERSTGPRLSVVCVFVKEMVLLLGDGFGSTPLHSTRCVGLPCFVSDLLTLYRLGKRKPFLVHI